MTADDGTRPAACVLFVANDAPASRRARETISEAIRQAALDERLFEVVDVHRAPRRALKAGCMATPSLLLRDPLGGDRWYVGDLSAVYELVPVLEALSARHCSGSAGPVDTA